MFSISYGKPERTVVFHISIKWRMVAGPTNYQKQLKYLSSLFSIFSSTKFNKFVKGTV